MSKILKVINLKKNYNGKNVLNVNNLEINTGQITAIIGPSGAGKTTLLSIINGIERPDDGKIIFEDEELSATCGFSKEATKRMAMVFQKPVMFNTTVYKNIVYGLKLRKIDGDQIRRRLSEAASWMGLEGLLNQKAITLSGGEAGRVSVARAMIIRPDLILMDEPTANLDPANVAIIEDMITKACSDYGATVIIVTHNMFQAKRLAHDVAFMFNGQIVETGSAKEIFENPSDNRTKEFISGNMVY